MKTTFSSEGQKMIMLRDYSKFSFESFKNDLMLASRDGQNDYLEYETFFFNTLNNIRGNHKPHFNKRLRKATKDFIMKRL